jgi:hypothetical protein
MADIRLAASFLSGARTVRANMATGCSISWLSADKDWLYWQPHFDDDPQGRFSVSTLPPAASNRCRYVSGPIN